MVSNHQPVIDLWKTYDFPRILTKENGRFSTSNWPFQEHEPLMDEPRNINGIPSANPGQYLDWELHLTIGGAPVRNR